MKRQVFVVLLILTGPVFLRCQTYLEIREKIVPLQSTRSDVEKIAKFIKAQGYLAQYEINGRELDVYYNDSPCLTYGWNVPKDTVINFHYGLRPGELLYDEIKKSIVSIETKDDAQFRSVIDRDRGILYRSPSGHSHVTDITFMPRAGYSKLRCKGFPTFDPARIFASYQSFTVKDPRSWDPEEVYPTIFSSKQNPTYNVTIFIYCKKGELAKYRQVKKMIEDFSRLTIGPNVPNIKIAFGGYRIDLEIETFVLSKALPAVTPSPTLPL